MSWMERLYQTYEANSRRAGSQNGTDLLHPLYHCSQKAQVSVILDGEGNFLRASVVPQDESETIVPATEESAGRSGSTIAPHPLFDTLQYVAGDYLHWGGNPFKKKNESGHELYMALLTRWVEWSGDKKLRAAYTYLKKGCLIADLVKYHVLLDDGTHRLMATPTRQESDGPPILAAIKKAGKKGQYEAFVRFAVEIRGDPQSELWKDLRLRDSWSSYYASVPTNRGLCMVTGEERSLASNHPRRIRFPGDGAKLVSSNDQDGFTFLGRFESPQEACGVGLETTHKAHNALRWLIARQGYRNGDQVIVSWAVSGNQLPDPFKNTRGLFNELLPDGSISALLSQAETSVLATDAGQTFALKLKTKIAGYRAELGPTDGITVMALDSATPGRISITYYRELTGSEFLRRIEDWHQTMAWPLRFIIKDSAVKKIAGTIWSVCAPAPAEIAEACYGRRLNDQLKKKTVERLLPCIVDGSAIPQDLVESAFRRATNRAGLQHWEWESTLGIACALYRGHFLRNRKDVRRYSMALEPDRNTRDYLYGRLLAIAEHMEDRALYVAGERRDTTAVKLMQRFADRPFSTWRTIELSLGPYKTRLRSKRPGFLREMETLINEIHSRISTLDYVNDGRLTGEYLLGYHCQQRVLRENQTDEESLPEDQLTKESE